MNSCLTGRLARCRPLCPTRWQRPCASILAPSEGARTRPVTAASLLHKGHQIRKIVHLCICPALHTFVRPQYWPLPEEFFYCLVGSEDLHPCLDLAGPTNTLSDSIVPLKLGPWSGKGEPQTGGRKPAASAHYYCLSAFPPSGGDCRRSASLTIRQYRSLKSSDSAQTCCHVLGDADGGERPKHTRASQR